MNTPCPSPPPSNLKNLGGLFLLLHVTQCYCKFLLISNSFNIILWFIRAWILFFLGLVLVTTENLQMECNFMHFQPQSIYKWNETSCIFNHRVITNGMKLCALSTTEYLPMEWNFMHFQPQNIKNYKKTLKKLCAFNKPLFLERGKCETACNAWKINILNRKSRFNGTESVRWLFE